MKTEEIKKQDELNDEQLDNVAGAGRGGIDVFREALKIAEEESAAVDDAAKG
jgi:hypothetical protein